MWMLKKLERNLNERFEKLSYRKIEIFYLVLSIVMLVSFIAAVSVTEWRIWKIIPAILIAFWIASMYLYYLFYDKINKEAKQEEESRYKYKLEKKVRNMLFVNETTEVYPKVFRPRNKENLSEIYLTLKKELQSCDCRMDAYLEEDGTIVLLFSVDNTFDNMFEYSGIAGYETFLKEWKVKK